jgi:hypothetical protein
MNETKLEVGQTWGFAVAGGFSATIVRLELNKVHFTLGGMATDYSHDVTTFRRGYPTLISPAPAAETWRGMKLGQVWDSDGIHLEVTGAGPDWVETVHLPIRSWPYRWEKGKLNIPEVESWTLVSDAGETAPAKNQPAPAAKEPPRCKGCERVAQLSDQGPLTGYCLPCSGWQESERRREVDNTIDYEMGKWRDTYPVPFPRASWPEPPGGLRMQPRWLLRDVKP